MAHGETTTIVDPNFEVTYKSIHGLLTILTRASVETEHPVRVLPVTKLSDHFPVEIYETKA